MQLIHNYKLDSGGEIPLSPVTEVANPALIIIGRLNYQEAVVYALILCSPPVMLLVERGNVDIVIYSWLGVALMMIKNSRALIFRLCAYLLIFFWGVIKLFPIFGLTVILEKKRNLFLFLSAIFAAAFITYFLASIEEMKTISQAFDVFSEPYL